MNSWRKQWIVDERFSPYHLPMNQKFFPVTPTNWFFRNTMFYKTVSPTVLKSWTTSQQCGDAITFFCLHGSYNASRFVLKTITHFETASDCCKTCFSNVFEWLYVVTVFNRTMNVFDSTLKYSDCFGVGVCAVLFVVKNWIQWNVPMMHKLQ